VRAIVDTSVIVASGAGSGLFANGRREYNRHLVVLNCRRAMQTYHSEARSPVDVFLQSTRFTSAPRVTGCRRIGRQ
jgi:hypothetical protein